MNQKGDLMSSRCGKVVIYLRERTWLRIRMLLLSIALLVIAAGFVIAAHFTIGGILEEYRKYSGSGYLEYKELAESFNDGIVFYIYENCGYTVMVPRKDPKCVTSGYAVPVRNPGTRCWYIAKFLVDPVMETPTLERWVLPKESRRCIEDSVLVE